MNSSSRNYHLQDISPCIRAATPTNCPVTDIEGTTRGNPPDIGAYENISDGDQTLPVNLISFTGQYVNNMVKLEWITESEQDNFGFEIQRNYKHAWEKIGFVKGNGTTTEKKLYSFIDQLNIKSEEFFYRLKQIDIKGNIQFSKSIIVKIIKPDQTILHQNYPNPFNPETTIKCEIPKRSHVRINIYNIKGGLVDVIQDGRLDAGYYAFTWNATDQPSGTYFIRLQTEGYTGLKKCVLLK